MKLLPCPNCGAKGERFALMGGDKIVCKNKSCELSRVPILEPAWQAIKRPDQEAYKVAYLQFKESIKNEKAKSKELYDICKIMYDHNVTIKGSADEVKKFFATYPDEGATLRMFNRL